MKILFLISQIPYPLNTGAKIRSFNLIKNLSEKHAITLIAFGSDVSEYLKKYCKYVILVSREQRNAYIQAIANLFSKYPYSVDKYHSKKVAERIKSLMAKERFDLIHCDSL